MRRNGRILAAAAAALTAVVVAAGVVVARDTGPARPAVAAGGPVTASGPTVRLSGSDVLTGKSVSLADFRGKPVVINIWASWCPGCYREARALAAFAAAHPEAAVIGVNFQDSKDGARRFYAEFNWTLPSVFDPDGKFARSLGLRGLPTTIFLDSDHREVTRIVGETDDQGFAGGLAAATGS